MAIITEEYVSFETAKLMKEKGFNEQTRDFYRFENNIWIHRNTYEYHYFNLGMPRWENCYSCPTLQMAMKWLREVHKIYIDINIHIILEQWSGYEITIYTTNIKDCLLDKVISCKRLKDNISYEQACEAAIKYCLENLI